MVVVRRALRALGPLDLGVRVDRGLDVRAVQVGRRVVVDARVVALRVARQAERLGEGISRDDSDILE